MKNNCKEIINELNSVTLFFSSLKIKYKSNKKGITHLIHILSNVPDFRDQSKITYSLENILALCFLIALKGEFTSFFNASLYVKVKQNYFIKLGLIKKNEIPSHDTFRRIFMYLDANELRDAFLKRIKYFMEKLVYLDESSKGKKRLLSGDGKTFNGSGRKDSKRNINVFNFYNSSSSLCLTSDPLDDKDSEIPKFQYLLTKFKLENAIVTGDALHCQSKTSQIIIERKGEYVFKVKDNQKLLKEEIISKFNKTTELNTFSHNQCEYQIIILDKNYIGCDWPGQKAYIKMISHKRINQKDYNPEPQYFISSSSNIDLIIEAIDNRWDIEDGLHLFKDSFLKEDECTFMDKNAIKTMATINNIVYGLYRLASAILNTSCMAETKIRYKDEPIEMLSLVLPLLEGQNLTNLIKQNMRGTK